MPHSGSACFKRSRRLADYRWYDQGRFRTKSGKRHRTNIWYDRTICADAWQLLIATTKATSVATEENAVVAPLCHGRGTCPDVWQIVVVTTKASVMTDGNS